MEEETKESQEEKIVDIRSARKSDRNGRPKRDDPDQEELGWLLSDSQLMAAIQQIISAAERYRDLIEARPFECTYPEAGADSVMTAGVELFGLTRTLDPTINGLSERAHQWAEERGCKCGDDFDNARNAAETAGFYIGVIFGARMAGYSREEMQRLGGGLFKAITGELNKRRRK